jgi:hypothetical protein
LSSYDVDGSSTTKEGVEKQGIRQIIREEIRTYLQDPLGYEKEFKGWLPEWIGQSGIDIPISQVIGFSQFTAQTAARIITSEGRTSSTYGDLATVGPTLTDLPDGQYLVLFGTGAAVTTVATTAVMNVQINSTVLANDDNAAFHGATTSTSVMGAFTATLNNSGVNTLTAKYRSGDNATNSQFLNRWLIALKYSNL